ncbi:MAG: hypothetical protein H7326_09330 [Bdellovibrionaceae bacterium]|nr:hypothetical protein [Pseudobdellovibrionaceae bacterium]
MNFMKYFTLICGLLTAITVRGVESQTYCELLATRSKLDPNSQLTSTGPIAKMDELLNVTRQVNSFAQLSKEGIKKKMKWESFKKFAAEQGKDFSNFYQPQYDANYLKKYCGSVLSESRLQSKNGIKKRSVSKKTFQLSPQPAEQEYSKQITSVK